MASLAIFTGAHGGAASEHVFRSSGLVLRYPAGWYVTNRPMTPVTNPVQRLVVSSYRLPHSAPSPDGLAPAVGGVVAVLMEVLPPYDRGGAARSRPKRFHVGRPARFENFGGDRWTEIAFTEHRRTFALFVGVGRRVPPSLVKTALQILDGLVVR